MTALAGLSLVAAAGRATLLQMRLGPFPVRAHRTVWAWLQGRGYVRQDGAGWRLQTAGYEALEAFGWGELAAPTPTHVDRPALEGPVEIIEAGPLL